MEANIKPYPGPGDDSRRPKIKPEDDNGIVKEGDSGPNGDGGSVIITRSDGGSAGVGFAGCIAFAALTL